MKTYSKFLMLSFVFVFLLPIFAQDKINEAQVLLESCEQNLEHAVSGGRNSEIRKNFEKDLKNLRTLTLAIQKDITAKNIKINLYQEVNFINEAFEKIKKLNEAGLDHHLYHDIQFTFSELKNLLSDLKEMGLYSSDIPKKLERHSDYLLELEHQLNKFAVMPEEMKFYRFRGSKIKNSNETRMARIMFLSGRVQNAVVKAGLQIDFSSVANIMNNSYRRIMTNLTDSNEDSKRNWYAALNDMLILVNRAKQEGLKVPVN